MDSDTKGIISVALVCSLVGISGIGGCTYLVRQNNENFYDVMRQCITAGGTFVPTAGGHSNAACINKAPTP